MFSILMPYIDREDQLWNTFQSFRHWYSDNVNAPEYEVILALDSGCAPSTTEFLINLCVEFLDVPCKVVEVIGDWNSPGPHYNTAARAAQGDTFILTSPEVLHAEPVLIQCDVLLRDNPDAYVVCGCKAAVNVKPARATGIGDHTWRSPRWYQHSVHRPSDYHFCTALTRATFNLVGGFDEAFGLGVAYDDNDFRDALIVAGVPFIRIDEAVTIHQEHSKNTKARCRITLEARNRAIYAKKCKERGLPLREN